VQTSPPPDRRHFLRLLGGTAGALLLTNRLEAATPPPADLARISVIHTTDLHGHVLPTLDYGGRADLGGFARCATQIALWRAENPNSRLIDVGDVYQGTQFSLNDQGASMIDLFNLLRYDAWIIGNHEFDWGMEPFLNASRRSEMPVLAANVTGATRIQPFLLKEIGGIRLAIVGLTTPGMPYWFLPRFTEGLRFEDPVDAARRAVRQAKSLGVDAIILAGHMGLKEQTGGDDFANRAISLTAEFPEAAVFIAGHTHQAIESRLTNGVILTQADHFGIHLGRVDLWFDRNSKRLLRQEAQIELMDDRIPLDPVILSRTQSQRDRADQFLARTVGTLAETLSTRSHPGEVSAVELLLAAAIREALAERGVEIDGVFHGLFDECSLKKGMKTIADLWAVLPYENFLVTGEFDFTALRVMLNESLEGRAQRSLAGFRFQITGEGEQRRVTDLRLADGRVMDPTRRYRIAMNSFDASSAGHRFIKLREMAARPEARLTFHAVETRDALIAYFRRHQTVRRIDLEQTFGKAVSRST
jgi:2',3'-cyclic-nucleotide 2'-phosphodiesterase (5'-nucleotidase family)